MRFEGSLCALVTPFRADRSLDLDRFGSLVEWHCESETAGLIVGGSTGESGALEAFELAALTTRALDIARGRLPILVGTGGVSTAEALAKLQLARQLGAQGSLAVTPYYSRPTQAGLEAHYRVLAASGFPVILYNVPTRTGCDLLPETVARLLDLPAIAGIKEARPEPERMAALLALKHPGFAVLSGDDPSCAASMLAGADGVISVVNNVVPRLFARLCAAARDRDTALVQALDGRLRPLYEAAACAPNPIPIKSLLAAQGRIENVLRLPLLPLDCADSATLEALLPSLLSGALEP